MTGKTVFALGAARPHSLSPYPASAKDCASLASLKVDGKVTSATLVPAGTFQQPAGPGLPPGVAGAAYKDLPDFCRVQATLTPTQDSDIKVEVWLPADRLERQVRRRRQRRVGGPAQLFGDGRSAQARLRGRDHRHRPHRQRTRRQIGRRPSREAGRFRLSRGPRDGRHRQGGDRRVLRQEARQVVLGFVLDRRPPGADGSLSLPGRFRRHQRQGPGQPDDRADGPVDVDRLGDQERARRRAEPADDGDGPCRGDQAVRQERRTRGWPGRGPAPLRLRSRVIAMQAGRNRRVPQRRRKSTRCA